MKDSTLTLTLSRSFALSRSVGLTHTCSFSLSKTTLESIVFCVVQINKTNTLAYIHFHKCQWMYIILQLCLRSWGLYTHTHKHNQTKYKWNGDVGQCFGKCLNFDHWIILLFCFIAQKHTSIQFGRLKCVLTTHQILFGFFFSDLSKIKPFAGYKLIVKTSNATLLCA